MVSKILIKKLKSGAIMSHKAAKFRLKPLPRDLGHRRADIQFRP